MFRRGFTLAETLIVLMILGVVSIYTIPKIITVTRYNRYNSQIKDVAGMLTNAYQAYRISSGNKYMRQQDLTPYFNYVKLNSTSSLDGQWYMPFCGNSGLTSCMQLQGGGLIYYGDNMSFCDSGADPTAVEYYFDADGIFDAKIYSVVFILYNNGFLTTGSAIKPNTRSGVVGNPTCTYTHTINPGVQDPPWFSW